MPVVGVLVQAQVGHDDEGVAHGVAHGAQCHLHDAVGVPGPAAQRVLPLRHPEEDEPGQAQRHQPLGLDHERVDRVLHLAGHGGDGQRAVRPLADEQRGDQVVDAEARLGHQPPQGRRTPEPP